MKKLTKIEKWIAGMIDYVGIERVLHFFVGLWIVTYGFVWGFDIGCLCFVGLMILSVAKEVFIDEKTDWIDAVFSVVGGMVAYALYIPIDWLDWGRFFWQ